MAQQYAYYGSRYNGFPEWEYDEEATYTNYRGVWGNQYIPTDTPVTTPAPLPPSLHSVKIDARVMKLIVNGDAEELCSKISDLSSQQPGFKLSHFVWETDNSTTLHIAAQAGQLDLISILISQDDEHKELLYCQNSTGDLPVHVAVKARQQSVVEKLVEVEEVAQHGHIYDYHQLQAVNNDNKNALHIALEHKDKKMARYLYEKCPKTFYTLNSQKISPLHLAIEARFQDLVHDMITFGDEEYRLKAEEILKTGNSVVHPVIMAWNSVKTKGLQTTNKKGSADLQSPRTTAASISMLTNINEYYSDLLHVKDERGRTALSYAAQMGFLDDVVYLLEETQLAFEVDEDGCFPIHKACSGGNSVDVVKKLLSHSSRMSSVLNKKGQNILHSAASSSQKWKYVIKYLLSQLDDSELKRLINMKDVDGNTPLHQATLGFHPNTVYVLTRDKRVNLTLRNNQGFTALDLIEQHTRIGDDDRVPSLDERATRVALLLAGVPRSERVVDEMNEVEGELLAQHAHKNDTKVVKGKLRTLLVASVLIVTATYTWLNPSSAASGSSGVATSTSNRRRLTRISDNIGAVSAGTSMVAAAFLIIAQLVDDIRLSLKALKYTLPFLVIASISFLCAIMVSSFDSVAVVSLGVISIIGILWLGLLCFGLVLVSYIIPHYNPTFSGKWIRVISRHLFAFVLQICDFARA